MNIARHGILLLLLAACTACSVQRSNHADRARTALVGLSKPELYRCAGLPDKAETVDGTEFLTYENDLLTSGGITAPIIGGGLNFFDSKYCHATFTLEGGRITGLGYAGNAASTLAPLDQCGYIVEACLAERDKSAAPVESGRPSP